MVAIIAHKKAFPLLLFFFSYMLEYNLSEGSYLWNHNAVVIYLGGICHEENSIIFKIFNYTN